jgi:pimeloyl-ACP methyl ester carboxylesterase
MSRLETRAEPNLRVPAGAPDAVSVEPQSAPLDHRARRPNSGAAATPRFEKDHAPGPWRWLAPVLVGSAAAMGAAVLYNRKRTLDAERKYPPIGRFLDVDGVRLHYVERGHGEPLVLIHGNGTMIQDFTVSGLVDRLSSKYRVIVIDRPGYGYSTRPRQIWTPRAHAKLFRAALKQLGVEQATVFGHSWGTLVAVALALEFPSLVRSLVLASGYYYPTVRADVFLVSPPAIPLIGDAMRYTISPPLTRAMLPGMIEQMFAPAEVPERFEHLFPKELMVRPSQIRASAEDAALMTPAVMELQHHYRELRAPVTIIAGSDDQVVDVGRHSERLHQDLPGSEFVSLPGLGHMVHHLAPGEVADAIERISQRVQDPSRGT